MRSIVKVNALVLGNRQHRRYHQVNSISFYKTAICREISSKLFRLYFCELLEKLLAAHQNRFQKVLERSQKTTRAKVIF